MDSKDESPKKSPFRYLKKSRKRSLKMRPLSIDMERDFLEKETLKALKAPEKYFYGY